MCNLYRLDSARDEVARWFGSVPVSTSNTPLEIYPGYPGLVVAEHQLRSMIWGFPLSLTGKAGQKLKPKPVNNAREDKLDSFMWRDSFMKRRCLIPVEAFAEAEGPKGQKTRTWLSVPDQPVFACAGIWRHSDEWGPVYSMVMTEPNDHTREVHDRMPVILAKQDWHLWTDGRPEQVRQLCVPYAGEIRIDRTDELWAKRATL